MTQEKFKRASWDFPSGPVVKNSPCKRDCGFHPWLGN